MTVKATFVLVADDVEQPVSLARLLMKWGGYTLFEAYAILEAIPGQTRVRLEDSAAMVEEFGLLGLKVVRV